MNQSQYKQRAVQSVALILLLLGIAVSALTGVTQTRATPLAATGSTKIFLPSIINYDLGVLYQQTFNGSPASPQPWKPADWDIVVHSRDVSTLTSLESMKAHHGPNCEAPLDSNGNLVTHDINGSYEDSVFMCKDHVMTAIKASGYGVIYLTPPALADFSQGEATIRFDVSTSRSSERDFLDVWLSPWEDNVAVPFDVGDVDLQGWARNAIKIGQVSANGNGTGYRPTIFKDFADTNEFPSSSDTYNWYTGYESMMTPSPQKRTTFEIKISRNRLRFGMPGGQVDQNNRPINNGQPFYWVDKQISPLTWSKAVVQIGHHSYNPEKDCGAPGSLNCSANTWHWDNVSIQPAQPFTIIRGDQRYVGDTTPVTTVNFPAPAPANAHLRFSAVSNDKCASCPNAGSPPVEVSYNGGQSWEPAQKQAVSHPMTSPFSHAASYWTPIPQGTQSVQFRPSQNSAGGEGVSWQAKDFAIWSLESTGTNASVTTNTSEELDPPTAHDQHSTVAVSNITGDDHFASPAASDTTATNPFFCDRSDLLNGTPSAPTPDVHVPEAAPAARLRTDPNARVLIQQLH